MNSLPAPAEALTLIDSTDNQARASREPIVGSSYRGFSPAAHVVAHWHDDVHPGAFSNCDLQPCDAVRRVES